MFSLTGKKALVTGASRGIGRGIAVALAKAGADVAVNYRSGSNEAEETAKMIRDLGRETLVVQADVVNRGQVRAMFNQIKERWRGLDILVNNAGIVSMNPIEKVTEEEWDRIIDTNLKGQFLCIQEALNLMTAGGKIVDISSIASGGVGTGFGMISHYAASKGGVIGLVEDLAVELGPKGININAIAPGVIESDMTAGMLADEKTIQGFLARIPKRRIGKPEDIGAVAVFLASDEADYITGSVIYVDGGWLAA